MLADLQTKNHRPHGQSSFSPSHSHAGKQVGGGNGGNSPRGAGKVAYILKGFPRLSEVFIANEIFLLEQIGARLEIFVVKPSQESRQHPVVGRISAPRHYLPRVGSLSEQGFFRWFLKNTPQFLPAHRRLFCRRPAGYLKTFARVVRMCFQYRSRRWSGPKMLFYKEFLQAGYIAARILEAGDIDHLHAHFCHGATTIAMMVGWLASLPYSFTAHAKDLYLKSLNPKTLLREKIRRARFVVTCTAANKICLEEQGGGTPVHVIRHGLDPAQFTPPAEGRPSGKTPVILSVGRCVKKKGFPYLVEACHLLRQRGYRFKCLIVGEAGEDSANIRGLIRHLNMDDTVVLHDALTQEELSRLYQEASIFALPCQVLENGDRDGIPNVLAEAMAAEVPVVSTPISGIPELVQDGVDGLLVPQRDAVALAAALERLLSDPALRSRLGRAGRQKIIRVFDSHKTTIALGRLLLNRQGIRNRSTLL